ncbi:D(4) dopamine receptor [Dissostichus eleginoides]|uniref:D(4) dopamine receptor n=1 Tax=Dissostichus eleginoides TaxID=100907 RepID=A0AAD9F732_DISEL|nr:D(4) dopamine receptor [Dissostichus eleginoides]
MAGNLSGEVAPEAASGGHNVPALVVGVLLIVVIIGGNLLVCLSVMTEKALKTTTNYFIFQDGVWTLSTSVCDYLMTMDVMLCTASIFNLCAISRLNPLHFNDAMTFPLANKLFIAVVIPLNYNRKHVDMRQTVLLSATWVVALAVASPVVFGINNVPGRDPTECKLENDDYVLYSSVCSFFIPCPIMLLLYCGMFRGLRRWEEARRAKLKNKRELTESPEQPSTFKSSEKPFKSSELKGGPVPTVSFSEIKYNQEPRRRKTAKINNRERKAMKVLPVVVVIFLHKKGLFELHVKRLKNKLPQIIKN